VVVVQIILDLFLKSNNLDFLPIGLHKSHCTYSYSQKIAFHVAKWDGWHTVQNSYILYTGHFTRQPYL